MSVDVIASGQSKGDYMKFEYCEIEGSKEFKAERRSRQARDYLEATDWYVIRMMDTGQPIPQEVSESRKRAREML